MSRSGYSDDCDHPQLWRTAVENALLGQRGQVFLKKLRASLDAMPLKRLIAHHIVDEQGDVCALGAVDPGTTVDPEDRQAVGRHFGIAPAMAAEIVYVNDEGVGWLRRETPEERWQRMRTWVNRQIGPEDDPA